MGRLVAQALRVRGALQHPGELRSGMAEHPQELRRLPVRRLAEALQHRDRAAVDHDGERHGGVQPHRRRDRRPREAVLDDHVRYPHRSAGGQHPARRPLSGGERQLLGHAGERAEASLVGAIADAGGDQPLACRVEQVGLADRPVQVAAHALERQAQRGGHVHRLVAGRGDALEQDELLLAVVQRPCAALGDRLRFVPRRALALQAPAHPLQLAHGSDM